MVSYTFRDPHGRPHKTVTLHLDAEHVRAQSNSQRTHFEVAVRLCSSRPALIGFEATLTIQPSAMTARFCPTGSDSLERVVWPIPRDEWTPARRRTRARPFERSIDAINLRDFPTARVRLEARLWYPSQAGVTFTLDATQPLSTRR